MSEQGVADWPSADILVSYDAERKQVRYTAISTGVVLLVVDLDKPVTPPIRHEYREYHC